MTDKRDWDDADWAFNNMVNNVPAADWREPGGLVDAGELEHGGFLYGMLKPFSVECDFANEPHTEYRCMSRHGEFEVAPDSELGQMVAAAWAATENTMDDPVLHSPEWDDIFPKPKPRGWWGRLLLRLRRLCGSKVTL